MQGTRSLALLGLFMGIGVAWPATAQQRPDIDAILRLSHSGNHAAALAEAQTLEAIARAQFGINHTSYAFAINALATVYLTQEKYDEAERLYRRAMAILEKVLGDAHPDVAHTLTNLATVYSLQRKYGDAEGFLRRALEIQTRALGESN